MPGWGLVAAPCDAYLRLMVFRSLRRWRDIRGSLGESLEFFLEPRPHRGWLWLAALLAPLSLMWMVHKQFGGVRPYVEPEVIYVQNYEGRTIEQIRAQQARDLPAEQARKAAEQAQLEKRKETFRKAQETLQKVGIE